MIYHLTTLFPLQGNNKIKENILNTTVKIHKKYLAVPGRSRSTSSSPAADARNRLPLTCDPTTTLPSSAPRGTRTRPWG
ncbi:phosphatidylinositol 4-phosphate 5-kinase [Trifolium repens]|nr:phosphatidylinositol 4-phosphate 5-kinase [Trifolium repens]